MKNNKSNKEIAKIINGYRLSVNGRTFKKNDFNMAMSRAGCPYYLILGKELFGTRFIESAGIEKKQGRECQLWKFTDAIINHTTVEKAIRMVKTRQATLRKENQTTDAWVKEPEKCYREKNVTGGQPSVNNNEKVIGIRASFLRDVCSLGDEQERLKMLQYEKYFND